MGEHRPSCSFVGENESGARKNTERKGFLREHFQSLGKEGPPTGDQKLKKKGNECNLKGRGKGFFPQQKEQARFKGLFEKRGENRRFQRKGYV